MRYLLIGDMRPEVHYLNPARIASMHERLSIAEGDSKAITDTYRLTFGVSGVRYALPVVPEVMERVALDIPLSGDHADEIRAMAAALALGRPAYDDPSSATRLTISIEGGNDDGGDKAPLIKPQPQPSGPATVPLKTAVSIG